jgi:uncharacterized phage protein gp47/JayE
MALPTQTFSQFVTSMQNAILTNTQKITNLASGSIMQATIQAVSGVLIALQLLIVHVFNSNRLASSTGTDVDSFLNDYGLKRPQATFAKTTLVLTRATTGIELDVAMNSVVQTPGSGIQFSPALDYNQASFDPVRGFYYFTPSQATISITIEALVAGTSGNVAAGTLTQIVAGFSGVNSVTNPAAVTNAQDAASDPVAKALFPSYIAGLPSACVDAWENAIKSQGQNVTYQLIEYLTFSGAAFVSGVTVVVDDGSGNASTPFLNGVYAAVDAIRAAGVQFAVYKPTNVTINIDVRISVASGASLLAAQANVTAALHAYINTLGVGVNATYVDIANVIQGVSGVFSYTMLTVNGGTTDVTILQTQLAQIGTVLYV